MQIISDKGALDFSSRFKEIGKHKYFLILLCFLLVGMLFGSFSARGFDGVFQTVIDKWFDSFISYKKTAGFIDIFFKSFLSGITYFVIIAVFSFGVSGTAVLPLIQFLRGFGTCILAGILYKNYSLSGIAFADLILLPPCIAADFTLLFSSEKGMELSVLFLGGLKDVSVRGVVIKPEALVFLKRVLLCMLAYIGISLAEATFTTCFIKYFNF